MKTYSFKDTRDGTVYFIEERNSGEAWDFIMRTFFKGSIMGDFLTELHELPVDAPVPNERSLIS